MSSNALYPIQVVAQRTGLSAHVIRMWERRYGVVQPQRTATNRREYSDADIERLALLGRLTARGQPIGFLAPQSTDALKRAAAEPAHTPGPSTGATEVEPLVHRALAAVTELDSRALKAVLASAETSLGLQGALQRVIAPLAVQLGENWREGALTAAHEHFASAILRTFLGHAIRPAGLTDAAPIVVVATPSGQVHELGALIFGALASNLGWRVIYLGANLPAAEIAGAARQHRSRVVGLSIVYPQDDPRLEGELTRLRELLPADVALIAGGRAAAAYAPILERLGVRVPDDLNSLGAELDALRQLPAASAQTTITPGTPRA